VKSRKVFLPNLSGDLSRYLAASLGKIGIDLAVLPPSDSKTKEFSDPLTTGEECWPLKALAGDYFKALSIETTSRQVEIFMPFITGINCNFNYYKKKLSQIFNKTENFKVNIWSPDLSDSDGLLKIFGPNVLREFWLGIVVSELMYQTLLAVRPGETSPGCAKDLYDLAVEAVVNCLKSDQDIERIIEKTEDVLVNSVNCFKKVDQKSDCLPLIGFIGEPFARYNDLLNNHIVDRLEKCGARVWVSPLSDEFRLIFGKLPLIGPILLADEMRLRGLFTGLWTSLNINCPVQSLSDLMTLAGQRLPTNCGLDWVNLSLGRIMWFLGQLKVDGLLGVFGWPCQLASSLLAFQRSWTEEYPEKPFRFFWSSDAEHDFSVFTSDFIDKIKVNINCNK
jgi:hypothetical protein